MGVVSTKFWCAVFNIRDSIDALGVFSCLFAVALSNSSFDSLISSALVAKFYEMRPNYSTLT